MGKRGQGEGPLSPRRVTAARKHIQALELRMAGQTWAAIATALGYRSHTGAIEAVKAALAAERLPPVEEHRRLTAWRLTKMLSVQWPRMLAGDPVAFGLCDKAIRGLREIEGLDAPAQAQIAGPGGGPIPVQSTITFEAKTLAEAFQALIQVGVLQPEVKEAKHDI